MISIPKPLSSYPSLDLILKGGPTTSEQRAEARAVARRLCWLLTHLPDGYRHELRRLAEAHPWLKEQR